MKSSHDDCPHCKTIDKRLSKMTTLEIRTIFGLPFQQWCGQDWINLVGEFPTGVEFAA